MWGMSGGSNSVETVNAAATAIITANSRVQQRRRASCFSLYWCFGTQRQDKRVNNSSFTPQLVPSGPGYIAAENPIQPPAPALPFVAPPSSPASFLHSEPTSATQSPGGMFSLTALSADAYSPGGPASIFAIGPYAHETQLVSPPVFSTFSTEPSTAPLTPPEPIHLTTPSSPEVPFAQLVMSSLDSANRKNEGHVFQSYQWYPGSPVGNLISPSSVCSGTSSPFPDAEALNGSFPSFPIADPPKLLTLEGVSMHKMMPFLSSRGDGSPVRDQIPASELEEISIDEFNSEPLLSKRVTFAFSKEEEIRKKSESSEKAGKELDHSSSNSDDVDLLLSQRVTVRLLNEAETKKNFESSEKVVTEHPAEFASESSNVIMETEAGKITGCLVDESYHDLPSHDQTTGEFKFEKIDGSSKQPIIESEWWAKEDVSHNENASNNWSFFTIKQPGIS